MTAAVLAVASAMMTMSRKDYDEGFKDGLKAFAHWKDGIEYVGTTGWTLKKAIEKLSSTWNYYPPKENCDERNNSTNGT